MSEGKINNCKTSQIPNMCPLMRLQMTVLTECLTTHATGKWPVTTMYVLMCLQMILPTK
jgi:hypothetical protein